MMSRCSPQISRRALALLLALLFPAAGQVFAQGGPPSPSAAARLGKTEAVVGERVPLQVTIGSANVQLPDPGIYVDGLDIRYAGQQTRVESVNFSMRVETQLTWIVVPRREGEFEIPALAFVADGKRVTTPPLKLRAGPSGAPGAPPSGPGGRGGSGGFSSQPGQPGEEEDLFVAELRLPPGRREFYAGEMIPVEIVFGADQRLNARVQKPPELVQKDFSTQKLSEPQQGVLDRGDRSYSTLTYRTAISPVKAGEVELPRCELAIEVISRAPGRVRPPLGRDFDPFDPSSVDRLFEEFFNDDPFMGMRSLRREMTLSTPEGKVTVKPLPREGRPASFDGAVGKFSMSALAKPAEPAPGDPVTLKIEIRGEGNFDSVTAPKLSGLTGWRVYPATSQFTPSNETNTAGVKTFEIVLVPGPDAAPLDQVEFSFFDPEAGQYRSLQSGPLGVRPQTGRAGSQPDQSAAAPAPAGAAAVAAPGPRGGAPSAPPPPMPRGGSAEALRQPGAKPEDLAADDLLHIQTGHPDKPRPLAPPWASGLFIWVNALAALAAAGFLLGRIVLARLASPESRKRRALAAENARLVALLRSGTAPAAELLEAAAKLLESHGLAADPAERDWVLAQRDRLRYGAASADGLEPGALRRRLLEALKL